MHAPWQGSLRYYQSYVNRYTLEDWLRDRPTFYTHSALAYLDPDTYDIALLTAAHHNHGRGQLVSGMEAIRVVDWIQDLIDVAGVIDPFAQPAVVNAYQGLTGVSVRPEIARPVVGGAPVPVTLSVNIDSVPTSDLICDFNHQTMIKPLIQQLRTRTRDRDLAREYSPFGSEVDAQVTLVRETIRSVGALVGAGVGAGVPVPAEMRAAHAAEQCAYAKRQRARYAAMCTAGQTRYQMRLVADLSLERQNAFRGMQEPNWVHAVCTIISHTTRQSCFLFLFLF